MPSLDWQVSHMLTLGAHIAAGQPYVAGPDADTDGEPRGLPLKGVATKVAVRGSDGSQAATIEKL